MTKENQDQSPGGILRDIHGIKNNGAASLTELREFISSLKGHKPQEVVEITASNGLIQGLVISTIGFVVILFVFTVIPFFMTEDAPVVQKRAAPPVNNVAPPATSQPPAEQPGTTEAGEDLIDKLQIGEAKEADPAENPLDNQFNDLLKDIK